MTEYHRQNKSYTFLQDFVLSPVDMLRNKAERSTDELRRRQMDNFFTSSRHSSMTAGVLKKMIKFRNP